MPDNINGQSLDSLREQTRLHRARSRLAAAKAEADIVESFASPGALSFGADWSTILNPFQGYQHDSFFGMGWALDAGGIHGKQDGRYHPFLWTDTDLDRQRSFARWLATKNGVAQGALRTLTNFIVKTGYTWEVAPAKPYRENPEVVQLAAQVQEIIDEFSDTNGLPQRERSAVNRAVRDGEVITRTFDIDDQTILRFVEPEQLREPPGAEPNCALGVETDPMDVEDVWQYWVTYDGTEFDAVSAADVQHLKRNVDECVKRGLSDFLSTGELIDGIAKLIRNMGAGAAASSAVAWIEKFKATTATQASTHIAAIKDLRRPTWQHPLTGKDMNVQTFTPGTALKVSENVEYLPPPSASNTQQYVEIVQAMMRFAATRWGMAEYMISGDASNANYSSTLVAGSPFVSSIECEQDFFGQFFLKWRWIAVRNACRHGRISGYSFEQIQRLVDIHYTPPQVAVANEGERAQVDHQDLAAGVMSLQTRRKRIGLDDEQELANLKKEPPTRVSGQATDVDAMGNPVQPDGSPEANGGQGMLQGMSESRKPGEVWQGPSGRWFTLTPAGHVAPAEAPRHEVGGRQEGPSPVAGGSKVDELHAAHEAHEEEIEKHHRTVDRQTARARQKEDRQIDRAREREDAVYEKQMDRKRDPSWERLDRAEEKALNAATNDEQKRQVKEQVNKEWRRLYDKYEAEDNARHQQIDARRDQEDAKREAERDQEDARIQAQRQAEEKERYRQFLAELDRAEEEEGEDEDTEESLQPTLADLQEAVAQKRKPGEVWQGPSGRWFTVSQSGRVVPAKNPHAEPKKPKAAKAAKADPEAIKGRVKEMLAQGKVSKEDVAELAGHLQGLTVTQLTQLKKDLGLKASGTKAVLAQKLAERALAAVGKKEPETMKEPAATKEPKAGTATKGDPDRALAQVKSLYANALELSSETAMEDTQRAVAEIGKGLDGSQVAELAKQFGLERKFSTKGKALDAIAQKIIDRKGAVDRAAMAMAKNYTPPGEAPKGKGQPEKEPAATKEPEAKASARETAASSLSSAIQAAAKGAGDLPDTPYGPTMAPRLTGDIGKDLRQLAQIDTSHLDQRYKQMNATGHYKGNNEVFRRLNDEFSKFKSSSDRGMPVSADEIHQAMDAVATRFAQAGTALGAMGEKKLSDYYTTHGAAMVKAARDHALAHFVEEQQ